MKIVIFTPTIQASAIARMARLTGRALMEFGHEVTVVRSESEELFGLPVHTFEAPQLRWDHQSQVASLISEADATIYHIGDNYPYHKGCLEWLPRCPGVVCLHDFFLGNLFNAWGASHGSEAKSILANWYGPDASEAFHKFSSMETFIEGTRNTSPLTEWVCSMAIGVITHSSWGIDRVLRSCPGPVQVVPLAYDRSATVIESRTLETIESFNILTVGNVNFNKRAESIIRAIGSSSKLQKQAVYRLVGAVKPDVERDLIAVAYENGVKLTVSGEVSDAELAEAISEADVMSCLRWPTLEAASASAIEAMLYGKPTIVTNAGFYSEIPDTAVIKVDPTNEISEITSALEQLLQDRQYGLSLGAAAKAWADETFSAENYARQTVELSIRANRAERVISMAGYFANLVNSWGGSIQLLSLEETLAPLEILQ